MTRLFASSLVWLSCLLHPSTAMNQFNARLRHRSISCLTQKRHIKSSKRATLAQRIILTAAASSSAFTHYHYFHRTKIITQEKSTRLHSSSSQIKTLLPPPSNQNFHIEEEIVKKSRFIGIAAPCSSWDEAQLHLEQVRKDHPKSRHVCFGFVSGGNSEKSAGTERCSDDGEPTGTAGVPILGAIKGEGLSDTLCIVVRYFGGIKLGAGGLIRAYGSAARLVLRSSPTQIYIPKAQIRLSTRTANSGAVYAAVSKFGGITSGETYNDRGELEVSVVCDEIDGERLKEEIVDATRGGVMFL